MTFPLRIVTIVIAILQIVMFQHFLPATAYSSAHTLSVHHKHRNSKAPTPPNDITSQAHAPSSPHAVRGEQYIARLEQDTAHPLSSLIANYFLSQSQKNCSWFVSLFDDQFQVRDPADQPPVVDKDTLKEGCMGGSKAFPQIIMYPTTVSMLQSGQMAAVNFHVGNIINETTGCALDFDGIDVFTISEAGLIQTVSGYYNVSIPQEQMKCSTPVPKATQAPLVHLDYESALKTAAATDAEDPIPEELGGNDPRAIDALNPELEDDIEDPEADDMA